MKGLIVLVFGIGSLDSFEQTTYDWFDIAPDGNWKQGAAGARWTGGLWDEPPFGILRFNNNHQLTMTNNVAGTYSQNQIIFGSSNTNSRTISGNTVRFFDFSGGDPKIENQSTGQHTISFNIEGDGTATDPLELNPVSGNLILNGTINNQGSPINIYGNNGNTITINGVISGSGVFSLLQNSISLLTAQNTYTGLTTITAGTFRLNRNNGTTIPATNSITVNGGTLRISSDQTLAALTVTSGTVQVDAGVTLTIVGNVTIPSGVNLILNGVLTSTGTRTLTIASGANVTIGNSSGLANATGTFSGGKTFTEGANYSVSIATSTPLGTSISANNFSTTQSITLDAALSITGRLSFGNVNSTIITTSGNLTLVSTSSATGCIGDLTNGGINNNNSISGNVTVERYIPALGVRGRYRFIASPVAGKTIADWMNNFYITGPGTGITLGAPNSNNWHTSNANIINATVTATSVLTYNEATISGDLNNGWTNLSSTSQAITPGLGFRAFLRGTNNGTPTNVTYTPQIGANANSQTQAAFTIALTGAITSTVNAGTVSLPASFNSSGTLANDGWNLVGNPYPSTIDWNAASGWTKTNIGGTIWIFNPSSNSYGNWDGATPTNSVTRYISSGQAFFVKASASPTFSCTEAVKVSDAGASIFKTAEINTLRIGLVKDETNKDETVIRFMEGKNNEFSEDDDVTKYYNPTVNVSSYFGADKYASVNYLKNELADNKIIPISAWVDEVGNYKLNFTGMNDFTLTKNIFLKDKFLNTITDVVINPSVDFVITSDSNSKGDNRFEIIFTAKGSTSTSEDLLKIASTNLTVYPNPATDVLNINISNSSFKNSQVVVYNVSGMEVSKSTMNGSTAQLNIESLSNGVYFVKVSNENGFNKTVKFVK